MTERTVWWAMLPSKAAADALLVEQFARMMRQVTRDVRLTCVDISPVFEFHNAASTKELDALYRRTPVSLPFPAAILGGMFPASDVMADAPPGAQCVVFVECQRWTAPNLLHCREIPWANVRVEGRGFFIQMNEDGTIHESLDGKYPGHGPIRGMEISSPGVIESVLCALAMFHVKNIGTREVSLPRAIRRRMTKEGYEGPQVYRTLTLRPFSEGSEKGKPKMQTGERPLHLVRGHFARYTEEKPLFGRYVGTFWRPEHDAGNPAVAVVRKTYKFDTSTPDIPPEPFRHP